MTRKVLFAVVAFTLIVPAVFAQDKSTRTDGQFVSQAIQTFNLDSVSPTPIQAEEMGPYYNFYPAVKNGKTVGYLFWARDLRVANHWEDVILLVNNKNGGAVLEDFWISHNDHHKNLGEAATHKMFSGMTYTSNWNESVDTVSGSTISSYRLFGEIKTALFVFQKYVIDADLLK